MTPTSGVGNAEITVTASANTDNDTRKGTVTIQAGTLEQEVEFSQLGRSSVPPAAAGTIEGKEEGARGETIILTIAPIEGAVSYRWYKDGEDIQTGEERTLAVTEAGTYKVAGLNASGLGEASPEKVVTFNNSKFLFTESTATYEGGDYNYGYHVRLTTQTAGGKEIGAYLIFFEEEPEGCDDPATTSITLPAREYLVTQPLYNNYTGVGTVSPSTSYGETPTSSQRRTANISRANTCICVKRAASRPTRTTGSTISQRSRSNTTLRPGITRSAATCPAIRRKCRTAGR